MHEASLVVARPRNATQLVLLLHGVGSSPADLVPPGEAIGSRCSLTRSCTTCRFAGGVTTFLPARP